jgi:hypothetical protein
VALAGDDQAQVLRVPVMTADELGERFVERGGAAAREVAVERGVVGLEEPEIRERARRQRMALEGERLHALAEQRAHVLVAPPLQR